MTTDPLESLSLILSLVVCFFSFVICKYILEDEKLLRFLFLSYSFSFHPGVFRSCTTSLLFIHTYTHIYRDLSMFNDITSSVTSSSSTFPSLLHLHLYRFSSYFSLCSCAFIHEDSFNCCCSCYSVKKDSSCQREYRQ